MRSRWIALRGAFVGLGICLLLAGCGDGESDVVTPPPPWSNDPDGVLRNLQVSWRSRDIDQYSALLADDFRFGLDGGTRAERGLPEFWDRTTERARVGRLFSHPAVDDIAVELQWPHGARPVNETGRERWVYYDVLDNFLEVGLAPTTDNPEGVVYRAQNQRQRFYFRKGKSEGDTLATSATAGRYYLVEWRDYGVESSVGGLAPTEIRASTWSRVKTIFD